MNSFYSFYILFDLLIILHKLKHLHISLNKGILASSLIFESWESSFWHILKYFAIIPQEMFITKFKKTVAWFLTFISSSWAILPWKKNSSIQDSFPFNLWGSGLGLAICRRLTELMGGRIWAKACRSHGIQFPYWAGLCSPNETLSRWDHL